jgi:hypothetical protein
MDFDLICGVSTSITRELLREGLEFENSDELILL